MPVMSLREPPRRERPVSEARHGVQLVPDVRREGTAGRYIYYRRGEVLIPADRWNDAEQILGPPRDRLSGSLRSKQRRSKHANREPFGFSVYPFDERRGPVGSVKEAIDLLAKKKTLAAERNYVSPPS